jgi:hypothetical protein
MSHAEREGRGGHFVILLFIEIISLYVQMDLTGSFDAHLTV